MVLVLLCSRAREYSSAEARMPSSPASASGLSLSPSRTEAVSSSRSLRSRAELAPGCLLSSCRRIRPIMPSGILRWFSQFFGIARPLVERDPNW